MRSHRIRVSGVVLTFVAAFFWPLNLLAINLYDIARPERVFAFGLAMWAIGLALIWILVAFGMKVGAAEDTTFVTVALVMSGGLLLRRFEAWLAYLIVLACPILVGLAFARLKDHVLPSAAVWAVAVALISGPAIIFVNGWSASSEPSVMRQHEPMSIEMSERPDIFLIVLDGYPGAIASAQDDLDDGVVPVKQELEERGFEVPTSTWASYWATSLSIPSLLEMNYPVDDPAWRGDETIKDLHGVIAGDNAFVDILQENGYTTHMIESGWSAGSCGERYDRCVTSFLIDEAIFLLLRRTIAWPLVDESPGPYALGALAAFDWLLANSPELSSTDAPDFVFTHVISPHAPYLLQSDCTAEFVNERAGTKFNATGVSADSRTSYLIEQIDCIDRRLIELADSVTSDDIIIVVSDHGTDRRDQSNPDLIDWDRETTVERLNNFLAVRLPGDCSMGDPVIIPNVLRHVLGCVSTSRIQKVPERMWVNPMVELDPEFVDELLGMRVSPESLEN